jgi:hypothetical protein
MLKTPHLATRRSNAYNLRLVPKQLDTIKHGMCFISTPTKIFMAKPKRISSKGARRNANQVTKLTTWARLALATTS